MIPTVIFIACHGGPADHFATFADALKQKGCQVEIYASGPALKKFQDRQMEAIAFSTEEPATQIVAKCRKKASLVITDVGHLFDVSLQEELAKQKVLRVAYYDNPERFVPGGYSAVAAQVMEAAQKVFFANGNLAQGPLYGESGKEVALPENQRIGIGYYPLSQAETIAKRRDSDQGEVRAKLFQQLKREDKGEKIFVYTGGNNEEYFSQAFPAFLNCLSEAKKQPDLASSIVLLQQHPGAKEKNRDVHQMQEKNLPQFFVSSLSSEEAQIVADAILYYQTSMGPQFVLAGIPTAQIGHKVYEDLVVKEGLCSVVTDSRGLVSFFRNLGKGLSTSSSEEAIHKGLGVHDNWAERLEKACKDCVASS